MLITATHVKLLD